MQVTALFNYGWTDVSGPTVRSTVGWMGGKDQWSRVVRTLQVCREVPGTAMGRLISGIKGQRAADQSDRRI